MLCIIGRLITLRVDCKLVQLIFDMFLKVQKYIDVMDPTRPLKAIQCPKTWGEKLHREEKATTNQFGLTKYWCPCTWYCGGGRLVLRSTIRGHFKRFGCHYLCTGLIVVGSICCSTKKS
jgi:hypothetical protein